MVFEEEFELEFVGAGVGAGAGVGVVAVNLPQTRLPFFLVRNSPSLQSGKVAVGKRVQ